MKTIVIYTSQTGFTKKYAEWISEAEKEADCVELSAAGRMSLDGYDAVIFGGWACGGSIKGLDRLKKYIAGWHGKKLIVFCVGASPANDEVILPALRKNFTEYELEQVELFYCPGGICWEKMPPVSRVMMKIFLKMLKSKKNKSADEVEMIKMISFSYDISDRSYIEPILDCLREN